MSCAFLSSPCWSLPSWATGQPVPCSQWVVRDWHKSMMLWGWPKTGRKITRIRENLMQLLKMFFFFWCAPFGYLQYFLSFREWTSVGYRNDPGMSLTPFLSSVGWDKIWTHNLLIVSLVCYPLDRTFALNLIQLTCCLPTLGQQDVNM